MRRVPNIGTGCGAGVFFPLGGSGARVSPTREPAIQASFRERSPYVIGAGRMQPVIGGRAFRCRRRLLIGRPPRSGRPELLERLRRNDVSWFVPSVFPPTLSLLALFEVVSG